MSGSGFRAPAASHVARTPPRPARGRLETVGIIAQDMQNIIDSAKLAFVTTV